MISITDLTLKLGISPILNLHYMDRCNILAFHAHDMSAPYMPTPCRYFYRSTTDLSQPCYLQLQFYLRCTCYTHVGVWWTQQLWHMTTIYYFLPHPHNDPLYLSERLLSERYRRGGRKTKTDN